MLSEEETCNLSFVPPVVGEQHVLTTRRTRMTENCLNKPRSRDSPAMPQQAGGARAFAMQAMRESFKRLRTTAAAGSGEHEFYHPPASVVGGFDEAVSDHNRSNLISP
jgi:hypothetical protein